MNERSANRRMMGVIASAFVVIAVGGGVLIALVLGIAATNSRFICGFGAAVAEKPLSQKSSETPKEFRQRVRQTRDFLNGLHSDLKDCNVPTNLRIAHNSQKLVPSEGVVPSSSPSSGNSRPGGNHAPSGGLIPGQTPGHSPSAPSPSSPSNPLKPVCDVVAPLGLPLSPLC